MSVLLVFFAVFLLVFCFFLRHDFFLFPVDSLREQHTKNDHSRACGTDSKYKEKNQIRRFRMKFYICWFSDTTDGIPVLVCPSAKRVWKCTGPVRKPQRKVRDSEGFLQAGSIYVIAGVGDMIGDRRRRNPDRAVFGRH